MYHASCHDDRDLSTGTVQAIPDGDDDVKVSFDHPGEATRDNHLESNYIRYYNLLVARPDGSFAAPEDSDDIVVRIRWLSPIAENSSGDGSSTDATAGISFKDDEFVNVKVLAHMDEDDW